MKNLSIRTLALRHIAVLLLSVLTIIVLSFILLIGQLQEKQQQEHQHKAKLIASNISQLIGFYREITQDLAKQPQVIELIRSGNSEKAQQWSIQTRSLLPNSNGLALLTNDGSFLGNPKSQKVGALCKKDLLLRKEGKLEIMPPIHYPSGKMSHFDIVTPVYLEDKAIGVLFASFSLEIIQRITQQLQHDEEHLLIQSIHQLKVAEVGVHRKDYKHSNTTINGSNWVLSSEIPPFKIEGFFTTYLSATLVLLLIIIIATALFAIRLGKIFIQDMQGVKQALAGVQKGEFLAKNHAQAKLKETCEVVTQINEIASNINHYQQQLITLSFYDELTGLHNRRTFFKEYNRYQAMIKRGESCTLLLFDLDNFKPCNDNYGHNFGDEVLKAFADILQNNIRGYDACARLGGDEFIVIFLGDAYLEIEKRYKQINDELMLQYKLWKKTYPQLLPITISAGAAVITDADTPIKHILECADKALYDSKNAGRAKISFYSETRGK